MKSVVGWTRLVAWLCVMAVPVLSVFGFQPGNVIAWGEYYKGSTFIPVFVPTYLTKCASQFLEHVDFQFLPHPGPLPKGEGAAITVFKKSRAFAAPTDSGHLTLSHWERAGVREFSLDYRLAALTQNEMHLLTNAVAIAGGAGH